MTFDELKTVCSHINIVLPVLGDNQNLLVEEASAGLFRLKWQWMGRCVDSHRRAKMTGPTGYLSSQCDDEDIVNLAFDLLVDALTHEAQESFHYRNERVFDPHKETDETSNI